SINFGIGTVVNSGTIATPDSGYAAGVLLAAGGSVTNAASASIMGGYYGVQITGGAGTLVNSGTIAATNSSRGPGIGPDPLSPGTVTNAGTITGIGGIAGYFSGPVDN